MRNWIIRHGIHYCCNKANKYHERAEMLLKQEGIKYIYSVGCNVLRKELWLKRVVKLQNLIKP